MPHSSRSNSGGIYHIPISQGMEKEETQCFSIAKWAFCFIPWCCTIVLFIYVCVHFHILHEAHAECKNELLEKDRNTSVASAQIGVMKQRNDELNKEIRNLKIKLELMNEELKTAQDKIELYYQTINELKAKFNLQISSDFLRESSTNGAVMRKTNMLMMFVFFSFLYIFRVRIS